MNTHLSLYILLLIVIISCNSDLTTIKEFSDDGILYKKFLIDQDSLTQGLLEVYYEDGKTVFEKANYQDGKLDGLRTLYYDSGVPEIIEQYKEDILTDTLKVFFPSGRIKKLEFYDNGVLTGLLTTFYENGSIKEEVTYADNIENGPFKEYFMNGHLKWQGQFLNGDNEIGELLQYDSSGVVIKKMMCDSLSVCRTFWTLDQGEILDAI